MSDVIYIKLVYKMILKYRTAERVWKAPKYFYHVNLDLKKLPKILAIDKEYSCKRKVYIVKSVMV